VPTKTRFRQCFSEKFGGRNCTALMDEANANNELTIKEERNCDNIPDCPKNARLGPFGDWSPCSETCKIDGIKTPFKRRTRPCKEASQSSMDALNTDLVTCEDLGEITETKYCDDLDHCPVHAKWERWSPWSRCTKTCGGGYEQRDRSYSPGEHGGQEKPVGWGTTEKEMEQKPCGREACPVPAKWHWAEWGPCDIHCYRPFGSYRGTRKRNNICTEGEPEHEFLNCNYPIPGLTMSESCGGTIGQCQTLTKMKFKVADIYLAGTNADVYLKLRDRATGQECETGKLDALGWSWHRNMVEHFTSNEDEEIFAPCKFFYAPKPYNLEFNMKVVVGSFLTTMDEFKREYRSSVFYRSLSSLELEHVELSFGPYITFSTSVRRTYDTDRHNAWYYIH